ncbi:MAG: winged helix-turn-helix domain-containing protein, partial [Rhodanobacter sp.]
VAHGQLVTLTPKVFDTLLLLVERAGHAVSKDELMAALWPRGFVHESNLTKHIWLIRKALGDDASHFIETIPKLGYRFTAPVSQVAAEPVDHGPPTGPSTSLPKESPSDEVITAPGGADGRPTDIRSPATTVGADSSLTPSNPNDHVVAAGSIGRSRRDRRRIGWAAVAVVALAVVLAGLVYRALAPGRAPLDAHTATLDPGAVAIAELGNLSGNAKDAWLGPALSEMLATEIGVDGRLHAVSDELVRPARADLPAPAAGGYSPASLATLQRRLGAHYVLSGAYLVSGSSDAPQLRIDLSIQDARTGAAVATLSRHGAVVDLPQLVAQTGAALRNDFGATPAAPRDLREVANAQPPSAEVARRIGFALDALHKYDPARARDELLLAIAQAPGYAPAYMHLAQAWSELGYRAKALAASKQALANAQGLPIEQRLQIQAQQFSLQADPARAVDTYQKLVALRPNDPEYRLQLIHAQTNQGKSDQAESSLDALRRMSGVADDPRIELAAARIAFARENTGAYVAHSRLALQQSQVLGESGLIASAELQLGAALYRDPQAEPLLRKAAADFRRGGNPHGEALAWQNLGNLQFDSNQTPAARETYQRAMTIYQGIGDLGGVAAVYDDLARMLWAAGDRDGAEAATGQSLKIARETSDVVREAWNLTALATMLGDEAAGDDVAAMYRQAIELDQQAGQVAHEVFARSSLADLLRMRGELDGARDACAHARSAARAADYSDLSGVEVTCAQVALDRGDVDAAVASLTQVARTAVAAKDSFDAANAQLVLGQIALGRRDWVAARDLLRKSLQGWTVSQEPAGQAVSQGLLALSYDALGDTAERDRAVAQARELRGRINSRAEILPLDIALAQLEGSAGDRSAAITALDAIAKDSNDRHWVGMALEANLTALRLRHATSNELSENAARDALTARAKQLGFRWVLQRVALIGSAPSTVGRH